MLEDRREVWRQAGERICRDAPAAPGVYVLKDADGRALYVGKAVHLRRRLRAHFAERRWRALKPEMSRAADAEWQQVGSGNRSAAARSGVDRGASAAGQRADGRAGPRHARGAASAAARRARGAAVDRAATPSSSSARGRRRLDDPAHAPQRRRSRRPRAPDHARSSAARRDANARRRTPNPRAGAARLFLARRPRRCGDAPRSARRRRRRSELRRRLGALLADDRLFVERLDQR